MDDTEDNWRAFVQMPDGLRLIFDAWSSKGKVTAWLSHPTTGNRDTIKAGEIGCNLERDAAALAKDIERRLLPDARKAADAARAKWAEHEAAGDKLAALVETFASIQGARAVLMDKGRAEQTLRVSFYESDRGCLNADITGRGSIYVRDVSLYGDAPADKLRAILALIAEA
jgi:hypothetical protein